MNKSPTFAIVSANVQGLRINRKRLTLFSKLAHSAPSIFLLSKTGHPEALTFTQWAMECTNIGLFSTFLPNNNTAILWRESASLSLLPSPSLISSLSRPCYGQAMDATFVMGNEEVTVVSVYIPVKAPQRKLYLIKLLQALAQVEEGRVLIVGGDWNIVVVQG
jgi:exonuclease III